MTARLPSSSSCRISLVLIVGLLLLLLQTQLIHALFCFGISSNSPSVCSGNGNCVANDLCDCQVGWKGTICDVPQCFGILGNSSTVCSSHGACTAPDYCNCNSGYSGYKCTDSYTKQVYCSINTCFYKTPAGVWTTFGNNRFVYFALIQVQ